MVHNRLNTTQGSYPRAAGRPRRGFTLVEMLVVITIISILAALVLVGAAAARRAASRAAIKTELDNLAGSFQEYKQSNGSFPPNALVTVSMLPPGMNAATLQARVLADLKRHFKQAFPKHQEPDALFAALIGADGQLPGGMSAAEAVYFWLGGFSSDVRYPISGKGGAAFNPDNDLEDLEGRTPIFSFDTGRLGPRTASNAFDENVGRFIVYNVGSERRRINFWTLAPRGYDASYQYFDTSRFKPIEYDPVSDGQLVALKTQPSAGIPSNANSSQYAQLVQFANPQSFQILHAGIDDEWGDPELWVPLTVQGIASGNGILYPTGPFSNELADTLVNFSTDALEDSQP